METNRMGDLRPIPRHHYTPSHTPIRLQMQIPLVLPSLKTSFSNSIESPTYISSFSPSSSSPSSPSSASPSPLASPSPTTIMDLKMMQTVAKTAMDSTMLASISPLAASIQIDHLHAHHWAHLSTHTGNGAGGASSPATACLRHHHANHTSPSALPGHVRRSFWNVLCNCLFSLLPDELIIFNIFAFLPASTLCTLQSVCRRWQFLSTDRVLWQSLDLSSHSHISSFQFSSLLSKVGASLQILKLCHCTNISLDALTALDNMATLTELHLCNLRYLEDDHLERLVPKFPSLQHLSLYNCSLLTDRSIRFLFNPIHPNLPLNFRFRLKELSVRGCVKLTDLAFEDVSRTLQALNIAGCKNLTSSTFSYIARNCTRLERLNAHGISAISDMAIEALAQSSSLSNTLSTLHISSSNPFGGNPQITDAALISLSQMQALSCVNLQGCANITDIGFIKFIQNCRQLSRLNVGGCYRLSDDSIYALADHNNGTSVLTHLSLFQCVHITSSAIIYLLDSVVSIQHIDLHSCIQMDSTLVEFLKKKTITKPSTNTMDSLEGLLNDLSLQKYTSPKAPKPPNVNDGNCSFVSPSLRSLDIGSCRNISPVEVKELSLIRPSLQVVHY